MGSSAISAVDFVSLRPRSATRRRIGATAVDPTQWIDSGSVIAKGYLATSGQLSKLCKRYSSIRRSATDADKTRLGKPRIRFVHDARRIYELTEGASGD